MIEIRHVLAAVDDSDWTASVLHAAGGLSRRFGSRLTVVHGERLLPPPYFTEGAIASMKELLAEQRRAAQQWLRQTASLRLGDLPFDALVVEQSPVQAILQTAAAVQADVIVLGTHGRSGLNRLLLGSIAERVVREAAVPVLTVRRTNAMQDVFEPRRILCPVNFRDVSLRALTWARAMASRWQSELLVVHVVEDEAVTPGRLEDLCAGAENGCTIRPLQVEGEAATQILQTAVQEQSDLIVIGAQQRALMEGVILGTTSVRVVRHAAAPVLVVPAA